MVRGSLAVCSALLAFTLSAPAQDNEQRVYTYVSQWKVPRAKGAQFAAYFDKNVQPVLDRLVADQTLKEWARTTTVVHSAEGMTDGFWWCANNNSGVLRVLSELSKLDQTAVADLTQGHEDQFLESIVFRTGAAKADKGFLQTSDYMLKSGKSQEFMELFKKWNQPVLEKLLEDGTIMGYGIDRESVHSHSPLLRSFWLLAETPEALDKVDAAFDAAEGKRSPEERRAIQSAFLETQQMDAHRDGLYRVAVYHRR